LHLSAPGDAQPGDSLTSHEVHQHLAITTIDNLEAAAADRTLRGGTGPTEGPAAVTRPNTARRRKKEGTMLGRSVTAVAALLAAMFGSLSAQAATIWAQPRPWGAGGTYIYIKGEIVQGDEQMFAAASAGAVPPVYVGPAGPGGHVPTALAIADMIWQRGYNTMIENGYQCASACAIIWASGYSHHAIARNSSLLRFHSCQSYGVDDMQCNRMIVEHLLKYGFSETQAWWAVATPHQTTSLGTQEVAAVLGLRWQWLPFGLGAADSCRARLCIIVP
jgi:hypothetical protein